MPIVDMPLEELKEYSGRNPRPADFDSYWDAGIAEMKGVDPQVELVPKRLRRQTPSISTSTSPG